MKYLNLILAFFVVSIFQLKAQGNLTDEKEKEGIAPNPTTSSVQLATNLVNAAIEHDDPVHLVSAAKILMEVPVGEFTIEKEEQDESTSESEEKENDSSLPLDPRVLLERAKSMSSSDEELTALINNLLAEVPEEREPVTRGAKYGRVHTSRRVNARSYYAFYITYKGGEQAILSIIGDGDTDLDFYVYDMDGNLLGSDEDYTDQAYFVWTPRYNTRYRVKVVNRGGVYNVFRIITN